MGLLMGGILIVALFCAGCATETVPDAEAELCSDLVELNASLARLESLNTSSTMDEFRSAADQVRDDMQQVRSSAADVQEARADELIAAQENLDRAIQDVRVTPPSSRPLLRFGMNWPWCGSRGASTSPTWGVAKQKNIVRCSAEDMQRQAETELLHASPEWLYPSPFVLRYPAEILAAQDSSVFCSVYSLTQHSPAST